MTIQDLTDFFTDVLHEEIYETTPTEGIFRKIIAEGEAETEYEGVSDREFLIRTGDQEFRITIREVEPS